MLKVISDSLLLTAGNRLSHAIYQQLFVFKTTGNGACYQKNRGFIRRLDRIFEICQRKRTQKYIFCVLDWRPRGESNPRPHAQEYGLPCDTRFGCNFQYHPFCRMTCSKRTLWCKTPILTQFYVSVGWSYQQILSKRTPSQSRLLLPFFTPLVKMTRQIHGANYIKFKYFL